MALVVFLRYLAFAMRVRDWRAVVLSLAAVTGIAGLVASASCSSNGDNTAPGDDASMGDADASTRPDVPAGDDAPPPMNDAGNPPPCDADLTSDPLNCASCGNVCTLPEGGLPLPDAGMFDANDASDGEASDAVSDAPADASSEASVDSGIDAGGLPDDGQRIATSAACVNSACTYSCPVAPNVQKCGVDGCFDTSISRTHCGSCGTRCLSTQSCVQGICCSPSGSICGGVCADTRTDPNNCGSCGAICAQPGKCIGGTCLGYDVTKPPVAFVDACTLAGHVSVLPSTKGNPFASSSVINLPFPFTFYRQPQSQLWIASAGTIGFGPPTSATGVPFCPTPDVATGRNYPAILVFDDPYLGTSASGICYGTTGTVGSRQFVVTWEQATESIDTNSIDTFSVLLGEADGKIDFVYQTATDGTLGGGYAEGNQATVGVQDGLGLAATQYSCGSGTPFIPSTPFSLEFTPVQ